MAVSEDVTTRGRPLPSLAPREVVRTLARLTTDPVRAIEERRAEHGDVFAARVPRWLPGELETLVFVCTPAGVREVLTDTTRFVKGSPVYAEMARSLGDGLLTSEGERWKGQRRTLQPLFTRNAIGDYTGAFLAATEVVARTWVDGTEVELVDEMEKVTLGSVSRALFGTDATAEVAPIVEATDWLSGEMVRRGQSAWAPPRSWPTRRNRRRTRLEDELRTRTDRIVAAAQGRTEGRDGSAATRARVGSSATRARVDLVARLHDAVDPQTGEQLQPGHVLEQALVFLLAGYDTTSTALATTLHLLGARQQVQAQIRAEVAEVVGDRQPTAADVDQLELTQRCLYEGMRLYPPAYITSRTATRRTSVDGVAVPQGAVLVTPFAVLHRHEDHWPDPEIFDPDRFLPEAVAARDRYAYLPFGGGPRSCIGERFAVLEATLALAVLLRRFAIATDGTRIPMRYGITQRASGPVRATLTAV